MYRLGEREHNHHKLYISLALFAVLVITIFFVARHFLSPDTEIGKTPAATITNVSFEQTKIQTVDVPYFTMSIPATWKLSSMDAEVPKPNYIWQGTAGEDKNRWLSVYIDANLANFAVNRALHVQASGPSINVIGSTSDNCTSFTGVTSSQTGKSPAKWESIDFLCDSGNYERDVVGIVSADGLNNVNLAGPTKGIHKYFFTFTDNSNQPDYNIFTEALKSFKAK
jgi:hypothetical protein